ncbi:MAG: GPW/gp25 family protein [Solitalea sp.]
MSNSFLGTGWSFPPSFDNISGETVMLSDRADIESSLSVLLSTRPGERVMLPSYGCNLDELVFESLTTTFKAYIKDLIKTAILFHEPRIRLNNITLDDSSESEGRILIIIDYTVKRTNSRANYVFPFYKNEGSEVK